MKNIISRVEAHNKLRRNKGLVKEGIQNFTKGTNGTLAIPLSNIAGAQDITFGNYDGAIGVQNNTNLFKFRSDGGW